jgi:hypothetical protein
MLTCYLLEGDFMEYAKGLVISQKYSYWKIQIVYDFAYFLKFTRVGIFMLRSRTLLKSCEIILIFSFHDNFTLAPY